MYNTVGKCIICIIRLKGGNVVVSFEGFTLSGNAPIYQQILLFLKRGAVSGTIRDGDELPSRRVLSALLGVNPNTVQKAYRLLEEEGLIQSHTGAKSCIVLSGGRGERVKRQLLAEDGRRIAAALHQMGLTREEALALIDRYWEEGTQ